MTSADRDRPSLPQEPTPPFWPAVIRLLRWDKPAGRLILMIPALWAVFLASAGTPDPLLVLIIVLGSITTSAAGCVVNDLWDRHIDPQVERTRQRPLAAKTLSLKVGLGVALVAFLCSAGLALYINPWANPLSFWLCVAAVPVIVVYPLAKRFFPVPQLVLSLAWGFAVLISWSAATKELTIATWILWGATVLWTLGFDTVYAMADRPDDRRLGINSSALFFGRFAPEAVGLCFVGTAICFGYLGRRLGLDGFFWVSLGGSCGGWLWQYVRLKESAIAPSTYGRIFQENVGLGFLLFLGIAIGV